MKGERKGTSDVDKKMNSMSDIILKSEALVHILRAIDIDLSQYDKVASFLDRMDFQQDETFSGALSLLQSNSEQEIKKGCPKLISPVPADQAPYDIMAVQCECFMRAVSGRLQVKNMRSVMSIYRSLPFNMLAEKLNDEQQQAQQPAADGEKQPAPPAPEPIPMEEIYQRVIR